MPPPRDPTVLDRLRLALSTIGQRARELDRLCDEALEIVDGLEPNAQPPGQPGLRGEENLPGPAGRPPAAATRSGAPGDLHERQAALLVAVTLRGGTVDADVFSALARDLRLDARDLQALFDGPNPHLRRRGGDAAGLTERGVEAAAEWRRLLPDELLGSADAF